MRDKEERIVGREEGDEAMERRSAFLLFFSFSIRVLGIRRSNIGDERYRKGWVEKVW